MRVIIQRVKKGSVSVNGSKISSIEKGIVLFLGIENNDTITDIEWMCTKVSQLRIFDDENKIMNKSLIDIDGDILIISQFTLHASTKKEIDLHILRLLRVILQKTYMINF